MGDGSDEDIKRDSWKLVNSGWICSGFFVDCLTD